MTQVLEDRGPQPVALDCPADFETGAILNIDKPAGWTSFDVVKKIRNTIGVKKVGHAGTLDPFATGILLVCTGRATKRVSELMQFEKEYKAVIELGKNTDTYDCTGTVLCQQDYEHVTLEQIQAVLPQFTGKILQTPPMYSAIKVGGKRLYELARKGVTIPRESREVIIHEIEIFDFALPFLSLRVTCSKGTYVRSLAFDLGEALQTGAHLSELVRTRIGSYTIEDTTSLAGFVQTYKRSKLN